MTYHDVETSDEETLEEWMRKDLSEIKKEVYSFLGGTQNSSLEGIIVDIHSITEICMMRGIDNAIPEREVKMLDFIRKVSETLDPDLKKEAEDFIMQKPSVMNRISEELEWNLKGFPSEVNLPSYRLFGRPSEGFTLEQLDKFRRLKISVLELFNKPDYEELMKEVKPELLKSLRRTDIVACLHDTAGWCSHIISYLLTAVSAFESPMKEEQRTDLNDPRTWNPY